jgi:hypothetical protein
LVQLEAAGAAIIVLYLPAAQFVQVLAAVAPVVTE